MKKVWPQRLYLCKLNCKRLPRHSFCSVYLEQYLPFKRFVLYWSPWLQRGHNYSLPTEWLGNERGAQGPWRRQVRSFDTLVSMLFSSACVYAAVLLSWRGCSSSAHPFVNYVFLGKSLQESGPNYNVASFFNMFNIPICMWICFLFVNTRPYRKQNFKTLLLPLVWWPWVLQADYKPDSPAALHTLVWPNFNQTFW